MDGPVHLVCAREQAETKKKIKVLHECYIMRPATGPGPDPETDPDPEVVRMIRTHS
jgi:hypothetical protein